MQGELETIADTGLFKDMHEVDLHRAGRDVERLGHLAILHPLRNKFRDLLFARGERPAARTA